MAMECRGSEPARPLVNSSLEIGPQTMESHLHPREFGPSVDSARRRRVLSVVEQAGVEVFLSNLRGPFGAGTDRPIALGKMRKHGVESSGQIAEEIRDAVAVC